MADMAIPELSSPEQVQAEASADAAMDVACLGYRQHRRCVDEAGNRRLHPHPECLHAQYRHDLILLEHGLLRPRAR